MLFDQIQTRAPWLWVSHSRQANQWAAFRARLYVHGGAAMATVAADTKYYLYVNGQPVVFEGGLNRGPVPGGAYGDRVDLSPYLKQGENVIAALVWYWGNGGRNNIDGGYPGFYFAMDEGETPAFKGILHPAYGPTEPPWPAYLYGGHNIGYDARLDIGDFTACDFDDSDWPDAVETTGSPLYARPIPPVRAGEPQPYVSLCRQKGRVVAQLPHGAQITPCFTVRAPAGCVIRVSTDHYVVPGGPGDDHHVYNGHRVEYITREGLQHFEGLNWLYGEYGLFRMDPQVEVVELAYRESGYAAQVTAEFESADPRLDRLVQRAQRTLLVCMRDNFMDCPDRERGQWIGDVSVQAPQALMTLDDQGRLLLKKAICDFISHRKGAALVGNVPGIHSTELPAQSLCAISRLGMIAEYVDFTGDEEPLELAYPAMEDYLKLWDVEACGLVKPRQGDWYWFDHGEGIDAPVLENAWYYSALCFYMDAAGRLGRRPDPALEARKEALPAAFERTFRHPDGYRSGDVCDDRANALAFLTGLAAPDSNPALVETLRTVRRATPYMEVFVMEALFGLDQAELAYERMMDRYDRMLRAGGSTLWEDFDVLGTRNHAWSGAPLTMAYRYLAGLSPDGEGGWNARPLTGLVDRYTVTLKTSKGTARLEVTGESVRAQGPVQVLERRSARQAKSGN